MDPEIHTVRPPVLAASISVLVFCLGMRGLALRNGLFPPARKCSCSLKISQQPTQWCALLTLIDLMREGEESLHPTVEIR
jgi:hypothetical protein